jgi:hypothetical protein
MTRLPAWLHAPALFALAALMLAVCGAESRAQVSLSAAVPGAVAPGKTTELTLSGAKLDAPLRAWTNLPAQIELVPGDANQKDKTSLVCKVTLPAGAPLGIGCLVLADGKSISEPLLIMVDDLPSVLDNSGNHDLATAQEVQLPISIDGYCDGTTFDYYRFTAKAGQRIAGDVLATRLGWDFDPVVRLLDAAGNEVLRGDDDPASGADTRFIFTAPADGQYVLELRDNRYKAGGRYRVRLGDLSLVSTPSPLAVSAGAASQVGFAGPLVEGIAPLTILAPLSAGRQSLNLSARGPSSQAAGFGTLYASDLPVFGETAPADKPDEASAAAIPGVVTGTLEAPKDRDLFQFTATKGTPVNFRSISKTAGSGAILMLRLLNAAGAQIAESPIGEGDEPVLQFTIPEDGVYKLSVEELAGRGGVDYTYAVEARTGPQFTLQLKADPAQNRIKHVLAGGDGALHLDVQCARFAYTGPIALEIESDRPGWQVFNNVIPANANEVRLYVVTPLDLAPADLAAIRIVGRADDSGKGYSAQMATAAQLRVARPYVPYPAAWLDGAIFVNGAADRTPFYRAAPDRLDVNFPRLVGQTQFTLKFDRLVEAFKDVPLTVLPLGLPPGVAAEIKRNGNGPAETYDIILKGPKDLAEGVHSIRYFAFSEMGPNGRGSQSGDLRLNVITPLAAALAPAGPIVQGQKQKVKLTLTRKGDDKQPVDVVFKALPAGVTAPEKTTLAADQNEVEVELSAAADAAVVKFEQLAVTATSKYAGTDISVESPAAVLEVKAP